MTLSTSVPELRIQHCNNAPIHERRSFVLYWMTAFRRTHFNFSLQYAAEAASQLGLPLVVFEALRCDYSWASDRLHSFVLRGMYDNLCDLQHQDRAPTLYYPFVETEQGAGKGLLKALAAQSALVVTDDFPSFFLPRMVQAAAKRIDCRLTAIDSNGLLPIQASTKVWSRAHDFRRFLQKNLHLHLQDDQRPKPDPLRNIDLPQPDPKLLDSIKTRWPQAPEPLLKDPNPKRLQDLPIDHAVPPVPSMPGGSRRATRLLDDFMHDDLPTYNDNRNKNPQDPTTSQLSPYIHFGHISTHKMLHELEKHQNWSVSKLNPEGAKGKRTGWWKMDENAEGWIDQFVTWRELGFNMSAHCEGYDTYESLPEWARRTLEDHEGDTRHDMYTLEDFEFARTDDPIWNAAQRQLLIEGTIHNYLRMLWGKKILHWASDPRAALEIMVHLNNKYALDGRNPNSYSGIFWVLGRYDRAWGPEREIFGKIRYMTSDSTARKLRIKPYLKAYGPGSVEKSHQTDLFT